MIAFLLANWKWIVPVVLLAGVSIDDGLHRLWLAECQLARAEDKTAAEKAKTAALEDARIRSDAIITEQAQTIAKRAGQVNTITERIVHVPVTATCAQSPAMRAASEGMRELFGKK